MKKRGGVYFLSDSYENAHVKLEVKCPNGHKYIVTWNRFQQGHKCPECYAESTSSKVEIEIFEFIKNIYDGETISNDRTQIVNPETGCNLELDVYLPELNKAIEFNGVYWHCLKNVKRRGTV